MMSLHRSSTVLSNFLKQICERFSRDEVALFQVGIELLDSDDVAKLDTI